MARDTLTGSRIRERRVAQGLRQAELARQAGISASYLNLIEHNRRRIGGKLLNEIAEILRVEPSVLSEGAGAALLATLREAAAARPTAGAELTRTDEFAGRFPGWARLLAESATRIASLERTVETLTDRMTHDPHLATSLHEMLTIVTAIRSAASILAEPGDIPPDWQARFHRNINEDSARLSETSRALVAYLEADGESAREIGSPQEEIDVAWEAAGYHIAALEAGGEIDPALQDMGAEMSDGAREMLEKQLLRYRDDALAVPLDPLLAATELHGLDPVTLSAHLRTSPARIMRRLAAVPSERLNVPIGLIVCDASGVPVFRKTVPDFPVPRIGAGCPLWPLYRALNRPHVVLAGPVRSTGGYGRMLWTDALAVPVSPPAVNRDPVFEAYMMLRPIPPDIGQGPTEEVGSACRVCPRPSCISRREPSVLAPATASL